MKCIKLTQDKYAIVDDDDYEILKKHKWCYSMGYAMRGDYIGDYVNGKNILMHREIMKTPKGFDTDHIDGDKLNNRKENLRIVTRSQNIMNSKKKSGLSSKYKGVSFYKKTSKWTAQICPKEGRIHLGTFLTEEKAARAYDNKAKELFGDYAKLNL